MIAFITSRASLTGVDRRIGLDEVLVGVQAQLVTASSTDDAHGHGLADAERVADGQSDVADLDLVGAPQGHGR
jgi:hypothetical protein